MLTITDPSEKIIQFLAKLLRDDWLGPDKPDLPGSPGVTVQISQLDLDD